MAFYSQRIWKSTVITPDLQIISMYLQNTKKEPTIWVAKFLTIFPIAKRILLTKKRFLKKHYKDMLLKMYFTL